MDALVLFAFILLGVIALWLLYGEGLIRKPWAAALCAILVALTLALRARVFDVETDDYRWFLSTWFQYYRDNGGFRAFGTLPPYCNYHVPYLYLLALFSYLPGKDLYLIKLLSVIFDLLLAWGSMKLLGRITQNKALRLALFFTLLLWPTVFLNGALWGQCDGIYVSLLVLGLWLALDDRPILSMSMMALAFAFKLQAVFVLPICAVLWFTGKYRWQHFLIFPLVYLLAILPAVLMGQPFLEMLLFHFKQTDTINAYLSANSPSVFALFWRIQDGTEQDRHAATMGIAAAGVYTVSLLALAWVQRKRLSERSILVLSLLFAIGIPFLLPYMHDRYFYAADVLSLILAFAIPSVFLTAPLVEFASFLGYFAYLSRYLSPKGAHYLLYMYYGSYALLAALVLAVFGYLISLKPRSRRRA